MKVSAKTVTRISTLLAIISWLIMVYINESVLFWSTNHIKTEIQPDIARIMLGTFIFSLFIFYKFRIEKAESINFVDLLWQVFVTGLIITVVSLAFRLLLTLLGSTALSTNALFLNFIYLSNLGLVCAYLVSTFIVWKRLINYQKSKFLLRAWHVFEYALLFSLLYYVLPFNIPVVIGNYYIGFLILLGILLSANMKWVAYLNFKQKWKSILLILLAMFYLGYFAFTLVASLPLADISPYFLDFRENVFLISILSFIFIYALFSLLVILFNLPTSSVFEQKLEEVVNFQRLSQSIQTEQSEDRVYDILLESAVSTVFADAAWIEIFQKEENTLYTHRVSLEEISNIRDYITKNNVKGIFDGSSDRSRNLSLIKGTRYRSILTSPITIKNENLGILVLLKDVSEGFNKEMSKIIGTFTNQAGISIENFRLLSEALENERYKEELKIAKRVQRSLLPTVLAHDNNYDILAFSEAADEVGGDYYDTYRINDHRIALVISDVSGKGTSAAFHMSQMKGMFHSLSQLDLNAKEFLVRANDALSRCLDKASFITTSYFIIDSELKEIEFARAGHCPTLFYSSERDEAKYFKSKGLGLGILRNARYIDYLQTNCMQFASGDIMVLYTDGITEAKNHKGEEFGYDRLKDLIEVHHDLSLSDMQNQIIRNLYSFTGSQSLDDDYTLLIIKFR